MISKSYNYKKLINENNKILISNNSYTTTSIFIYNLERIITSGNSLNYYILEIYQVFFQPKEMETLFYMFNELFELSEKYYIKYIKIHKSIKKNRFFKKYMYKLLNQYKIEIKFYT